MRRCGEVKNTDQKYVTDIYQVIRVMWRSRRTVGHERLLYNVGI